MERLEKFTVIGTGTEDPPLPELNHASESLVQMICPALPSRAVLIVMRPSIFLVRCRLVLRRPSAKVASFPRKKFRDPDDENNLTEDRPHRLN